MTNVRTINRRSELGSWRTPTGAFAAGADDTTPNWPHWLPGHYNPTCSSCWHGFPHTTAYHQARIESPAPHASR